MSKKMETSIFWYHPNFLDERVYVCGTRDWVVLKFEGNGFLPVWKDKNGEYNATIQFFDECDPAINFAKNKVRVRNIENILGLILVALIILFIFNLIN